MILSQALVPALPISSPNRAEPVKSFFTCSEKSASAFMRAVSRTASRMSRSAMRASLSRFFSISSSASLTQADPSSSLKRVAPSASASSAYFRGGRSMPRSLSWAAMATT